MIPASGILAIKYAAFIKNAGPEDMAWRLRPRGGAGHSGCSFVHAIDMKSQALADALQSADLRAASTYSGRNMVAGRKRTTRDGYQGHSVSECAYALWQGSCSIWHNWRGRAWRAGAKAASNAMTNASARNLMATILLGGTASPSAAPANFASYTDALAAVLAGQATR
jgi:hypothetical protein